MKSINAKELKQRLDAGEPIKLVNALEENKFLAKHIPGSLNLLMKEDIEKALGKNDQVVVYCTDVACNKSIYLYQLLEAIGYTNVYRFAGGLVEWEKEGYPMEGTMKNN